MDHDRAYSQREHELVPGFLRGYRCWYLAQLGDEPHLASVAQNYAWTPGRLTAQCLHQVPNHHWSEAPKRGCGCGFYATYVGFPPDYIGSIEGSIKAEGRIIMGQRGFRAQYATVEALCFGDIGLGDLIRRTSVEYLKEAFEVPFFDNRRDLMDAFPPQDVSHLIGEPEPEPPPPPRFDTVAYATLTNWLPSSPKNVRWTLLPRRYP